jgi:cation diffusion facilitator CzcD-associated flavoprotein CzcO
MTPRTTAHGAAPQTLPTHVDVLVVGAGISGIGLGHYLTTKARGKSFAIVDARDEIGGTWSLFRYPGIRSDSDLHTFGYRFKPWTSDNAIADAHEILDYLGEAVAEDGLAPYLHFGYQVVGANWSSTDRRWTSTLEKSATGEVVEVTSSFLFSAAGYYDYAAGHSPEFEGSADFRGQVVHPQNWPEDLEYAGKKVVVIGSGATAVTLIPAMAETAGHVTMLQRSPGYVLPLPRKDPIANGLRRALPDKAAYAATRRLNVFRQRFIYTMSQKHPAVIRRLIRSLNARQLPDDYEFDTHFNPTYNPWDQRLCVVPDGDLFKVIREGKASVVTDTIARFTEGGILLESGTELDADIIVTATGLQLLAFGGMKLSIDGEPVVLKETLAYKSMMLSGVPNFAFAIGYTNSSWTLKVDLVCDHFCRMLAHMDTYGYTEVRPVADDPTVTTRPLLDFGAGYVQRSVDLFPRQGSHGPWTLEMSYAADRARLEKGPVEDPALRFSAASDALVSTSN